MHGTELRTSLKRRLHSRCIDSSPINVNTTHDGDTLSLEFVMTQEAVEEIKQYISNPRNMIARGKFKALFSTDIAAWTLTAYTSPKPMEV